MSLMSRKSDTHNHLARRIGKKHSSLHTVTPAARADGDQSETHKTPSPFAPIQFTANNAPSDSAYKPIFRF